MKNLSRHILEELIGLEGTIFQDAPMLILRKFCQILYYWLQHNSDELRSMQGQNPAHILYNV